MRNSLRNATTLILMAGTLAATAQQRYLEPIFSGSEINVTSNVTYGVNLRFFPPVNFADPDVPMELGTLHTLVAGGQPIPAAYYNPSDTSTTLKVQAMNMDIYEPDQGVDNVTARPLAIYLHTGNALPPPVNGSPNGSKTDSSAVEICTRLARYGYVAVSVQYRHGWNPLDTTLEGRRGTLLNAIYRGLHDVKQAVRYMRDDAAAGNTYAIDATKAVMFGEGTGGYMSQAYVTLDKGEEMFIEKFRPDPFDPNTSYIDTNQVGNIAGFCTTVNPFCLSLYQSSSTNTEVDMSVNMGGALPDTSWLEPGDAAMVAFHTVFDPFAPFTEGVVIVPTTGEQVVPVQGSNLVVQLANDYGNNAAFATLPGDPFTDRARSLYGTTIDGVVIRPTPEGLFPTVRPHWPAPALDEASPWQWWDPNSALAQTVVIPPNITAHQASLGSNPDMSPAKARAYIDTIMGYSAPRIVCQLQLGPCSLVNIDEASPLAIGVDMYPNPATDIVTISSQEAAVLSYEIHDLNARLAQTRTVNSKQFNVNRGDLESGVYFVTLHFEQGSLTRKLVLK